MYWVAKDAGKETPISFVFEYDGENLKIGVKEAKVI